MEGQKSMDGNLMRFEDLKANVAVAFEREGFSPDLKMMIDRWHDQRYMGTDLRLGTISERGIFQTELAKIHAVTGKRDEAFNTLEDARYQVNQEKINKDRELDKALANIDYLVNKKRGELLNDPVILDPTMEIEYMLHESEKLGKALKEIEDVGNSI